MLRYFLRNFNLAVACLLEGVLMLPWINRHTNFFKRAHAGFAKGEPFELREFKNVGELRIWLKDEVHWDAETLYRGTPSRICVRFIRENKVSLVRRFELFIIKDKRP